MSVTEIIELVGLGITILCLIGSIIVAIVKGKMKDFIIAKMEEIENSGKSPVEKLQYVIDAVKEEYKILTILINVKNFIEKIIGISKQINYKKGK